MYRFMQRKSIKWPFLIRGDVPFDKKINDMAEYQEFRQKLVGHLN